jgi:hypothetical protein
MGNTYSENVVQNIVKVYIDVLTSITQDCSSRMSLQQFLLCKRCVNVQISNVNFRQWARIDTNCLMSAEVQNRMLTEIENKVQQFAETIGQSLRLTPGSEASVNVTQLLTDLGTTIRTEFVQNCVATVEGQQVIDLEDATGVTLTFVNLDQTLDAVRRCVLNSSTVNDITDKLKQTISQTAVAKVEGLFKNLLPIILIVLIVGVVVVIVLFVGGRGGGGGGGGGGGIAATLANPVFIGAIAMVVLALLALGFFFKWWPYVQVYDNESDQTKSAKNRRNYGILFAVIALIVVDGIMIFVFSRMGWGLTGPRHTAGEAAAGSTGGFRSAALSAASLASPQLRVARAVGVI